MAMRYDNLWLDTTMSMNDYFAVNPWKRELLTGRPDRVMYGTDFPNVYANLSVHSQSDGMHLSPFSWDHELKVIKELELDKEIQAKIFHQNAERFYSISPNSYDTTSLRSTL